MSPVLQGSALWRASDPAATKIRAIGERGTFVRRSRCRFERKGLAPKPARVVLIPSSTACRFDELGLQGSALWRTSDPAATKIRAIGAAKPRRSIRAASAGSCARDWRPNRHALVDAENTANRLDEPCFAGVCPIASPDPAATKIRGREATAIHSRSVCRFVRKGLTPKAARKACCCVQVARRAPEYGFTKIKAYGAGTPLSAPGSCARD
jgi:hypothetical protein